jgi:hypothetical protein
MGGKSNHILSGGSTLLGITLALIAGLKVSGSVSKTYADEIAGVAALLIAIACALSYLSLRNEEAGAGWERRADATFMAGLVALIASVAVLMFSNLQ